MPAKQRRTIAQEALDNRACRALSLSLRVILRERSLHAKAPRTCDAFDNCRRRVFGFLSEWSRWYVCHSVLVAIDPSLDAYVVSSDLVAQYGGTVHDIYPDIGGFSLDATSATASEMGSDPTVLGIGEVSQFDIPGNELDSPVPLDPPANLAPADCRPVNKAVPWKQGTMAVGTQLTGYGGSWDPGCSAITSSTMWWDKYSTGGTYVSTVAGPFSGDPTMYTVQSSDIGYILRLQVRKCNSYGCTTAYEAWIDASRKSCALTSPSSSNQCIPTAIDRIHSSKAVTLSVAPPVVAVLDTGVYPHSDLDTTLGEYSCVPKAGGGLLYGDDVGHGTNVAGIIGAKNNSAGIVGVMPGAKVYSIKVGKNDGTGGALIQDDWIACGLQRAVATLKDVDPAKRVDVVNMSWGSSYYLSPSTADAAPCNDSTTVPWHQFLCNAYNAGLKMVAASGNSTANFGTIAPATYSQVLAVTASTDTDGATNGLLYASCGNFDETCAGFSNYSTTSSDKSHTIAAPGNLIMTTDRNGGYSAHSGTSFSAPAVSGALARCIYIARQGLSGGCTGGPSNMYSKIRADAQSYGTLYPWSGFYGDPSHSTTGDKYFGYEVDASKY
jgi:subtilisin